MKPIRVGLLGIGTPLVISSETDFKDSSRKIAYAGQAGLGIEREYYLAGDERSLHQKKLYEDFLVRLFELAGVSNSATVLQVASRHACSGRAWAEAPTASAATAAAQSQIFFMGDISSEGP